MRVFLTLVVLLALAGRGWADEKAQPKVYVILWFDTEDYILPASDDAALQVAQYLTKQGIRGTFKIVGHKARTLEKRKRFDVIEALKKHEIGYHSNWHSTQPTPAMFCSNVDWDEGVEEFDRREGQGWKDVERIFGAKPSCYGQPGSSWSPQSYGALRKWGMVYLDAGSHISLDRKPCYYAGVFNLYHLEQYMRADINKPEEIGKAKDRFDEGRAALLKQGGGVVSIVYHPCEWVHKEFWDGVNFRLGANPAEDKWVKPKQKTEAETKLSYKIFDEYITHMKRHKDVVFITASEAAKLYADRAKQQKFTVNELKKIAESVSDEVTFQKHGDYTLSASEVFDLLNRYVALKVSGAKNVDALAISETPLGPTSRLAKMRELVTTDDSQFTRTAVDVAGYMERHGRLPGVVWLGSDQVTPEAYLVAVAKVAQELMAGKKMPQKIELSPAKLAALKYISEDKPQLWGWVIFPKGFNAPHMMDLARRQAWTIKPALLHAAK